MPLTVDDFHPLLGRRENSELVRLIGELDLFRGTWRKMQEIRAERLVQLRQVTTIESTASSTRIEGVELTDAEVARVLEGIGSESFRARDEEEVKGYAELLARIYESHAEIRLTENHIKGLHKILLGHSTKDERHRGEYKKQPNDVVRKRGDIVEEVVFNTATPFDTPRLMTELVEITNAALEDRSLHPLVVIARFIVDFLAIHPFQDGNGRLARALTTLLLLRSGYDYVPYASLERVIEENKPQYYLALRESQLAMRENASEFGSWLFFFLKALKAQQDTLASKLQVEKAMLSLSDIQQRIADLVAARVRMTGPDIARELQLTERAARYHLDVLSSRGIIAKGGRKRGAYYTTASNEVGTPTQPPILGGTNEIVAEIYERGGRISKEDLLELVRSHGYDGRVVGILHGRRLAHLRRDPKTKQSILTSRGEEIARQFLFARRLSARTQTG
ncbi:MAG TPA: Fic family protein [Gemmatimonadaceae bacterium]|nr:Fic family protein [Gemmatimonadaceae bacterium]